MILVFSPGAREFEDGAMTQRPVTCTDVFVLTKDVVKMSFYITKTSAEVYLLGRSRGIVLDELSKNTLEPGQ